MVLLVAARVANEGNMNWPFHFQSLVPHLPFGQSFSKESWRQEGLELICGHKKLQMWDIKSIHIVDTDGETIIERGLWLLIVVKYGVKSDDSGEFVPDLLIGGFKDEDEVQELLELLLSVVNWWRPEPTKRT